MTKQTANAWANRLTTGLFTIAAAWGSVAVEIRRVVDARAEITEARLTQRIDDQMSAAMRYVDSRSRAQVDSLNATMRTIAAAAVRGEPVRVVTRPVQLPVDTVTHASLEVTNERLRMVALAIAQLRNQVAEMAEAQQQRKRPLPKYNTTHGPTGQ